jgi:RNA polymerase sigma factor (sigma-70 family)
MRDGRRFFRPRLAFRAGERSRAPARSPTADVQAERFRALMLPQMEAAYSLARYLARDGSAAEDIVQNAYLQALRGFSGFRGEAPKAWLFAIVRNCFLDWARANRAPGGDSADRDGHCGEPVDDDTPEAILARTREIASVRATLEDLPEPFREAVVLREIEELSYKEIAMITGVPIGTVMSRLARGRRMLCDLLLPADGRSKVAAP